jgi:uncharacterized repeat protein (TIGR01451 family)
MKRLTILTSIGLGLGLALGLLWLLGGSFQTVRAQGADGIPIYYVAPAGNCGGASPCYSTVQAAVDAVDHPNDVIKVAAGTYTDVNSYGGRTQVVYVDRSVTIRGGYTTADWSTPDPDANPTTLDAQWQGRVLYITGDISTTVEGLHITGGDATGPGVGGGGVYVITATTAIRNCRIFDNIGYPESGLSIWLADVTLTGNTIVSNTDGCGVCLYGSDGTLDGNTISFNGGIAGGGLSLYQSNAMLTGNTIAYNVASMQGGGMYLNSSDVTLINNIIADNRAGDYGSGLYVYDSSLYALHTTIARNHGWVGGGVHIATPMSPRTVAFTNTILVSHTLGIYVASGAAATLESTLWGDSAWANTADWGGLGTLITGTHNYWGDPGFVAPDSGDYHIGTSSAAIDGGIDAGVADDMDGQSRPHHAGYDLGADEWWPLLVSKTATPDRAEAGETVTYTLTLTNLTDAAMTVRLTDSLPIQVNYLGPLAYSSGDGGYASGVLTWTGTVNTATPASIAWAVQITPGVACGTVITNDAVVSDAFGVFQTDPALILVLADRVYLPVVMRQHP